MSRKKKKPTSPRRKRMKRSARLASARSWLATFEGKNVVRGYAKCFGVDYLCAVKELGMLGITVDPTYVAQLECTRRNKAVANAKSRARKAAQAEALQAMPDGFSDETFAFIAGRTGWGFASGTTWEEHWAFEERERSQ